ncbi:hypothetical protein P3T29_004303 [Kitasatospora sp. MAP5-34]|nr:hypothetical protein [Kitasatospora sp. MAP5-34]
MNHEEVPITGDGDVSDSGARSSDHGAAGLINLGRTRWRIQPDFVLRGAGFPVADALALGDRELAAAADCEPDQGDQEKFAPVFAAAADRSVATMRELLAGPLYAEALTWQNLQAARTLRKLVTDGDMSERKRRRRMTALTSYIQRYTTKNDTVGFFGPVAWARIAPGGPTFTVDAGPALVRSRAVFFEWWVIDTLAGLWSQDSEIVPGLRPVVAEHWSVRETGVRGPRGRTPDLSAEDLDLLLRCDGSRTVAQLAETSPEGDVHRRLGALAERGMVVMSLAGPFEAHPEYRLRDRILDLADGPARTRMLSDLDELIAGRDRIAAGAGDVDALERAMDDLNGAFERITGASAVRRGGETYAGRTLVYEDTTRDFDLVLGAGVLDRIAEPLGLVLDSAAWLVDRVGAEYEDWLCVLHERLRAKSVDGEVTLDHLVGAATRGLEFGHRSMPQLVADLSQELRAKWTGILAAEPGARRHQVRARDIADRVRAEFPSGPARWSSAQNHSPDLLIAAADAEAVARGDFFVVLGEVHPAMNTLESRPLVNTHPDPARQMAFAAAHHAGRRVVPVPSRYSTSVTSRTYPPALLSEDYTYWSMHSRTTGVPGRIVPAADLVVSRVGDRLTVAERNGELRGDLLEFVGEYLSGVTVSAFGLTAAGSHSPRITVDELVVARESWSFKCADLTWPAVADDAAQFLAAWRWQRENGLPQQVFFLVNGEIKPMYLDFASPASVRLAAKMVRASLSADREGTLRLSEMLPTPDQCWLPDAQGRRYTSELRMVCSAINP